MHLSVSGDTLIEHLGLILGLVPRPLVHTTFGMGYARAAVAAVRLGIFRALGEGELVPDALAQATGCSEPGVRALCAALTGFGLLHRRRGAYRNSAAVRRYLLPGAAIPLEESVLFMGHCQELIADLEAQIQSGVVERLHDRQLSPEFWRAYMGALAAFAPLVAREIVRKVRPGPSPTRLLDVGGGHGRYAAALVARHPGLTAEVLDLPEACAQGRRIQQEDGFGDRVLYREGDFRAVDWGEGYDIVLVFNVLHNATASEAADLIARAYQALRPGGVVVIMDAVHQGDDGDLDASAGWNELFFFLISGAQAWPEPRIRGWMEEAGFTALRRAQLMAVPQFVLQGTR